MTLPVTFGFFTDSFTFRSRSLAVGHTVRSLADSHTFGTIFSFTGFIRTFYFTLGFLTFDITYSITGFLTGSMASVGFTDRVTDGGTFGIGTLPGTFWVTFGVVGVGFTGDSYS